MFEIFGYVLVIVYSIALIYITIYCLMQLHLLYRYLFSKAEINKNPKENPPRTCMSMSRFGKMKYKSIGTNTNCDTEKIKSINRVAKNILYIIFIN